MARESKKKAIQRRLALHLEGITPISTDPEGPYLHDLTNRVYRGRVEFGEEVEPPFLSILEAPRSLDPMVADLVARALGRTKRQAAWPLLIHGFATDDRRHPTDPAYDLLADVEARLSRLLSHDDQGRPRYPAEYGLGEEIEITFVEPIVRPPQGDISDTAFFYLPLILSVVSDMRTPYTAG